MKHKIILLLLLISCLLTLAGCGKKDIDHYSYASYHDFESSAGEVSEKYSIYIEGKLSDIEVMEIDNIPYLIAYIKESKDKEWICRIGQAGRYSDKNLYSLIGKKILCFGDFVGKKDRKPILKLHLGEEDCISSALFHKPLCSESNLIADEQYLIDWCNKNCENSVYSQVENQPGTYRSTGLIEDITSDANSISFNFYQKKDDTYYKDYVSDSTAAAFKISDFSQFDSISDGDAINIYYVVNEIGTVFLLGYDRGDVDFTLGEAKESSEDNMLLSKNYDWEDYGDIAMSLTQDPQSGNLTLICKGYFDSSQSATVFTTCIFDTFNQMNCDYSIYSEVSADNILLLISHSGDSTTYIAQESDGSVVFAVPSWFRMDDIPDDMILSGSNREMEIFKDFGSEVGNLQ